MKKIPALFLVIAFILWILPLGVFIKPYREKLACDGQRAICMCHVTIFQSSSKALEHGIVLKAGPSTNKEGSSGGAGNDFISAKPPAALNGGFVPLFQDPYFYYKTPFLSPLESVPKF